MEESIFNINKRLDKLEVKLDLILELIKEMKVGTGKMETHIDFVENIYDTVKVPFHFAMKSISSISSTPREIEQ
jgi:hypothetical protein